jgi:PhoH-like ATPase
VPFLNTNEDQANDNRIINVALRLSADFPGAFVCLVTKDINMRIKAKGSGLKHVEDYRHDRVLDDIDLLSTGYECFAGDFWSSIEQVDTVREGSLTLHRIRAPNSPTRIQTSLSTMSRTSLPMWIRWMISMCIWRSTAATT